LKVSIIFQKNTSIISSETLEAINVVVEAIKETLKNEIEPEIYPQIGADVVLRLLQSGLMKFS